MTLIKNGAVCDICGEKIEEQTIKPVEIKGIPAIFHVHNVTRAKDGMICEHHLRRAALFKNWKLLPECYLKEAYRALLQVQTVLEIAEREGGEEEMKRVAADVLRNV